MVTIILDNLIAPRPGAVVALMVHGLTALGFEASYIRDGLSRDSRHKLPETERDVDSQSKGICNRSGGSNGTQDSSAPRRPSELKTRFAVVKGLGIPRERFPSVAAEIVGELSRRPGATDISVSVLHVGATLWISGRNPAKEFSTWFSVTCPETLPRFDQVVEARNACHSAALELASGLVRICLGRPHPASSIATETRAESRAHGPLVST